MRNPLRLVVLLSALLLLPSSLAADTGPVVALRAFFTAVSGKDYAAAWAGFTHKSQDRIAEVVAKSEKMSVTDVRKLFDTNDKRIRDGFWESFRTSSNSDTFLQVAMSPGAGSGSSDGSVLITAPNGNVITMLMYRENGGWKVGWMETFFSNKDPAVQ